MKKRIIVIAAALVITALVISAWLFAHYDPKSDEKADVPAFSYAETLQVYKENDPGVKYDGFQNTSESKICTRQQAIDRAKNECTIEYDAADVFYDSTAGIWRVTFYTDGSLGGCQDVYLNDKGLTHLIVYGE